MPSLDYPKPDELPVTLADIMQNVIEDTHFLDGCGVMHRGEGVELLPANIEMSSMKIQLINAMSRESVLRTYIHAVKPLYDYIFIDCMPSLGIMPINALTAADSVIIPSRPSFLSAKGLDLLMQSVAKVKQDEAMADSVRQYGLLVPALVRPKADGGYEMVAGHRRKCTATPAVITQMPCIIHNLTDDEVTIIMVDSNLQRETILPSEKVLPKL